MHCYISLVNKYFLEEWMNEYPVCTTPVSYVLYKISRLQINWLFLRNKFTCILQLYFHKLLYNNSLVDKVSFVEFSLYPYASLVFLGSLCFMYLNLHNQVAAKTITYSSARAWSLKNNTNGRIITMNFINIFCIWLICTC